MIFISSSGIVEVDVVLYEYSRVPVRVPCTATGTSTRQDFSLSRFNFEAASRCTQRWERDYTQ